jgi:hypothetical protein
MTWKVTNDCVDQLPILLRVFDPNDYLYWPGNSEFTVAYEATQTFSVACTNGNPICYGAEQPSEGYEWGASFDGSTAKTCTNCCAACSASTVTVSLTCN